MAAIVSLAGVVKGVESGQRVTVIADTVEIAVGKVVYVTGIDTTTGLPKVAVTDGAERVPFGVSYEIIAADKKGTVVRVPGMIVEVTASGTVTAGEELMPAAAGAVATFAAPGAAKEAIYGLVGIALQTKGTGLAVQIAWLGQAVYMFDEA